MLLYSPNSMLTTEFNANNFVWITYSMSCPLTHPLDVCHLHNTWLRNFHFPSDLEAYLMHIKYQGRIYVEAV